VKRARQAVFKANDFSFIATQTSEGMEDALWGTCLHVPMFDAKGNLFDCKIGITLPVHVKNETWPRDEDDAAKHAAQAANAMRKVLLDYPNADNFTCRVYTNHMRTYLSLRGKNNAKPKWPGAGVFLCGAYKGTPLPDFKYYGRRLLVGDYREWSKEFVAP
jgi:hypothetical protein